MKVPKNFMVVIKRFSGGKYQEQEIEVKDFFELCGERTHDYCKHGPDEIVLRGHQITSIDIYPHLKRIVIRTRKAEK